MVTQACEANRVGSQDMLENTAAVYGNLLHSFQKNLPAAVASNVVQPLIIAVLLGIYEVLSPPLH